MIAALLFAGCGTRRHNSAPQAPPRADFSVFDRPATAADAVLGEVATGLAQSQQPEFSRAEIGAARRVLANDPGWLLPAANGEICLVRLVYPLIDNPANTLPPLPAHRCATEASAQMGRLVETQALLTSGTRVKNVKVIGVVPNGVTSVTIASSGGRHTSIAVLRNAYEAVVVDPVSVRFVTHHDHRLETNTVPLTTFKAGNAAPTPSGSAP